MPANFIFKWFFSSCAFGRSVEHTLDSNTLISCSLVSQGFVSYIMALVLAHWSPSQDGNWMRLWGGILDLPKPLNVLEEKPLMNHRNPIIIGQVTLMLNWRTEHNSRPHCNYHNQFASAQHARVMMWITSTRNLEIWALVSQLPIAAQYQLCNPSYHSTWIFWNLQVDSCSAHQSEKEHVAIPV
jgi:hypothetical protein